MGANPWAQAKQNQQNKQMLKFQDREQRSKPCAEESEQKQFNEPSNFLAPLFDEFDISTSKEECHVQCVHMI